VLDIAAYVLFTLRNASPVVDLRSLENVSKKFFDTPVEKLLNVKISSFSLPETSSIREVLEFFQKNFAKPHRVALHNEQMKVSHIITQTDLIAFAQSKQEMLGPYVR
jgi:CBS-domain-containing membrane protein